MTTARKLGRILFTLAIVISVVVAVLSAISANGLQFWLAVVTLCMAIIGLRMDMRRKTSSGRS